MPATHHGGAVMSLTVDLVIFTVRQDRLRVLLVERGNEPYRGQLALPGGYLRGKETLDQAALSELREETNLDGTRLHLEQLLTYSDPDCDLRGRVITSAYLASQVAQQPCTAGDPRRC